MNFSKGTQMKYSYKGIPVIVISKKPNNPDLDTGFVGCEIWKIQNAQGFTKEVGSAEVKMFS